VNQENPEWQGGESWRNISICCVLSNRHSNRLDDIK